jgi:hypothetical protein
MTLATIRQALYDWVTDVTGIETIYADQSTHRPDLPYAVINFKNAASRTGIDEIRWNGVDGFDQVGDRSAPCTIDIFGAEANDKMANLLDTLHKPEVIEAFTAAEIVSTVVSGPVDLTYLEDETDYVERSQMELSISYTKSRDAEVDPIETVEVDGNIEDVDIDFTVET